MTPSEHLQAAKEAVAIQLVSPLPPTENVINALAKFHELKNGD